jgi:hypothetical protein
MLFQTPALSEIEDEYAGRYSTPTTLLELTADRGGLREQTTFLPGFPDLNPPAPPPPPHRLSFFETDRVFIADGPAKGYQTEFLRDKDGTGPLAPLRGANARKRELSELKERPREEGARQALPWASVRECPLNGVQEHAPVRHNPGVERPPRFVPHEIVRIATATGRERDLWFDEPFDAKAVVGQEAVVQGAMPDGEHWLISAWVELTDDLYYFPEDALEKTGRVREHEDDGSARDVPFDRDRDRWRDDVLLHVVTDTTDRQLAGAIAEDAAETLAAIEGVDDVEWRLDEWTDEPYHISFWAWSHTDALQAFGRIVTLVESGWEHDEDEDLFVTSEWQQTENRTFLARGIREAAISYRRWMSPVRRSRSEIAAALR